MIQTTTRPKSDSMFSGTLQPDSDQTIDQSLIQTAFSSWIDGLMVLTPHRQIIHYNAIAHDLCARLSRALNISKHFGSQGLRIPQCLWDICTLLIEHQPFFEGGTKNPIVLESDIKLDKKTWIRARVRWFQATDTAKPNLLVILEDRYQSIHNAAIADVDRYALTPREAEVWILRQMGYTRQAIADELYISIDTVKKHLSRIRMKQDMLEL